LVIESYYATLGSLVAINIILALSQNIVTGYAGQVSIGQAAFMGIGAYSSAILSTYYGLPFWISMPLAIIITTLVGTALGAICLRLSGDFLAVATLGLNFVVASVFLYVPFFGGAFGIGNIKPPVILGHPFNEADFFFFGIFLVVITVGICKWLDASWIGLALRAIREDELAAEAMGVNTAKFKIVAFIFSTAYAGLAGCYYAHFMTFIHPNDFQFTKSIQILTFAILGGIGTIRGALLGSTILTLAPEFLRFIEDYRMLVYGLVIVLVILFQPSGLIGEESILWRGVLKIREKIKHRSSKRGTRFDAAEG